jgi:pyruvate dehydrogenase E2 component (dihydrolipoamide acetyltransferase)
LQGWGYVSIFFRQGVEIMASDVTMPKLSDTMSEGRLIAWKKGVGEAVKRGEIIAEVETDKAIMELEAFSDGVLLKTMVTAGQMVPVGTVIALIGTAAELTTLPQDSPEVAVPPVWQPPATAPPQVAESREIPERVMTLPVEEVRHEPSHGGIEKASPLVRRLAREHAVDLAEVTGSGPGGRILEEDLQQYLIRRSGVAVPLGSGEPRSEEPGPRMAEVSGKSHPLSRMRAAIARTVAESWQTIPHFAVTVEVDMAAAEEVRRELKTAGTPVSMNDLVVKACAMALVKHPGINASFLADGILQHEQVNIGIAVALEEGLVVPVLKGCQALSLKEIGNQSRTLAERARAGRITEQEITGGTFSVSNLGMYGVDEFFAVIMPPQGAILAVGAVSDRPVIKEGSLAVGRCMRITLSADHRLIDGATAARFLQEVQRVLETPVLMLV